MGRNGNEDNWERVIKIVARRRKNEAALTDEAEIIIVFVSY